MARNPGQILLRHLRKLLAVPSARELPDQQLLERFVQQHDEVAFEALVRRHGPMVLGVCRRVLRHEQDAEDAFQATFLVLAQKAASVRKLDSVSSWLYGVAIRIAGKAKMNAGKRRHHEQQAASQAVEIEEDLSRQELLAVLDEELHRLPEKYRAPLVLCYLEGKTQEEAARELAWTAGSVKGRLERGRDALRARMARRGITLPATLLMTLLARKITVQAALLDLTVRTATLMMAGQADSALISTQAARLAAEAMRAMLLTKVKVGAVLLLIASMAAAGTGMLARGAFTGRPLHEQPPTGFAKKTDQPAPAKPTVSSPTVPTFHGTVRFQGRAVSDATVWMTSSGKREESELAKTKTDDRGQFTLPVKPGIRWVVARDGLGHLGWFETSSGGDLALEPALDLDLYTTGEVRGKLLGSAGEPLHGRIQIYAVSRPGGAGPEGNYPYNPRDLGIRAPLAKELETSLAEDGSFLLRGVPARSKVGAFLTAPGYDNLCISWDQQQPLQLQLEKPGGARVRFTGAADLTKLAGLSFRLERQARPEAAGCRLFLTRQVQADSKGTLLLKDLYPGVFSLSPQPNAAVPVEAETPDPFKVQPGSLTEVAIAVKPKAKIGGRIIDRVTGKGIPDVRIQVIATTDEGRSESRAWVQTDAGGRFSAYTRPGKLSLSFTAPAGYLQPEEFKEALTVAAGDSFTFPDIAFEPAVPVEGVVEDSSGRPIPGIRVLPVHAPPPYGPPPFGRDAIYSDAAGHFTLRSFGPKDFTVLRARTAKAVTKGAIPLDVAKQKGPIRLVLSETDAFRLRGRVRDNAGQPVADAAVQIEWHYQGVGRQSGWSLGARLETYRTDADGRFQTQALWPGDNYQVFVSAADHGPGESRQVKGEAGRVLDLRTISLPRTAGNVAGVVVDGAGQPVAGAKVFNEGDAPGRLQTTTDAAGRFELQGLFEGPVYVFARKPGYRFSMARTRSGDLAVQIRMLKAGEPVPAAEQPNARPPAYVAAEKKLTRHLLERLWALPRQVTDGYENDILQAMAAVDLAQAKKWLAEETRREPTKPHERMSRALRVAEAEKAADGDPDETITLLSSLPPQPAFEVLLRLAERFARDDPGKAARFAEEAVVRARAVKLPERASALAQAGDLVIRLGKSAAGRKLLTEAADLAEQFGTERMQGFARAKVAELLAPVDVARARSLLKGFTDRENDKYRLARVAVKLAATDLHQALAILDGIQPGNTFVRAESRLKIAYLLAEKDAAEAVKQAEAIAYPSSRAIALSGVAAVVGHRDPALARSLIDRVLDIYLDRPEEFRSGMYTGGRTAQAAWTAYHARLAHYPDMASVVTRVLACRPTTEYGYTAEGVNDTLLRTAIPLSLAEPVTARQLVEKALPEGTLAQGSQRRSRQTLFAVALADPERGIRLVDDVIEDVLKSNGRLFGSNLVELMSTLAAPSENQRVRLLNILIGNSWTPGTEDYP